MKYTTRIAAALAALIFSACASAQYYPLFGPANGILKGSTTTPLTTAAAASDVASLFSCSSSSTVYLAGNGTCPAIPGAISGANPTGTVGLTAVNGSATTYLRSDGAPSLSQAIAPTWTGAHTFTPSSAVTAVTINQNASTLGLAVLAGSSQNASMRIAGNGSSTGTQLTNLSAGALQISQGVTSVATISSTGAWSIFPGSGTAMAISGVANSPTETLTGALTSGQSLGLQVLSGTTSADYSLLAENQAGTATFLELFGDGHGNLGPSATNGMSWNTSNQWTWSAPTAGGATGFTFNGRNGNNAMLISTGSGAGTAFGLQIQAGSNASDYGLFVQTQGGSTSLFKVLGSGSIQGAGATAAALVDMTPDKGTFTATYTGMTATVTCTASWVKMGLIVQFHLCGATGTSNATTFTITGIPSEIQPPALTQYVLCGNMLNNGAAIGTGGVLINAGSGTWTPSVGPGQSVAWNSAAASKGISNSGCDFSFQLQ